MNDKQNYHVELEVITTHEFLVEEAASQEDAEEFAKEWFEEGDIGHITGQEIFNVDSYPVEIEGDKIN